MICSKNCLNFITFSINFSKSKSFILSSIPSQICFNHNFSPSINQSKSFGNVMPHVFFFIIMLCLFFFQVLYPCLNYHKCIFNGISGQMESLPPLASSCSSTAFFHASKSISLGIFIVLVLNACLWNAECRW